MKPREQPIAAERAHTGVQPLSSVAARSRVRLCSLGVNGRTGRRLAALGLTVGATATVMQTSPAAVVVATRGTRLALGRSLAAEVLVAVETPAAAE